MPSKTQGTEQLNANFSDLQNLATRQAEAFLEAQSAFTQTIQETNSHWVGRLQTESMLATDLAARLSGARTMQDAADAWREWADRHASLMTEDVKRAVADGQTLWQTGAKALTGGWSGSMSPGQPGA